MDTRQHVERYVLQLTNQPAIEHSVGLFESGYLSSLDVLDLLAFIEETFSVAVSGDDLTMDNFGSIDAIVRFVDAHRHEPSAA